MVNTVLLTLLTLITGGMCIPSTYFYFVDYSFNKVYRTDPANPQRYSLPVAGALSPTAVGYDEQNEHVYVYNGRINSYNTSKFILKYHFNSGGTQRLELLRSAVATTIAVDSASGLLYYADRTADMIVAVTTDFRYQTVIIDRNLDRTSDIALDTVNKVIYWCDWSRTFPYIGKANMDGSSRRNIITHGLYEPYAITLDIPDNKIYWVDQSPNVIERCNTDGTGREMVLRLDKSNPILFSVAVDETYVYWVQRLRGAILKQRKYGVQNVETIGTEYRINTTDYRSLRLVRTSPPPQSANACSARGGCEHICIPTPQSRVCRCSEGFVLQPDGTSCQEAAFNRGVVAVDIDARVLIVLDLDTNITKKLTDTWYSDPRGIALDETTFEIFWSDRSRRAIFRTCIPIPCYQVIKTYTQESYLGGVALDTKRKTIYVGDSGLGRITKLSYSGNQEEAIIQGGFTETSVIVIQITLDTNARKMYWATADTIEVANMDDGSNRIRLLSRLNAAGLSVGGLVLDTKEQRLYVLRFDKNDLEVIDLVRGNILRPVHQRSGTGALAGLALGDGMLYFSNRNDGSMIEFNPVTQEEKIYGQRKFKRAFSIVYFNRNLPTPEVPAGTGAPPDTVSGAEGAATTTPSGGGLLNQTLIIALSVTLGGVIIIIGIIICGVVVYKRTLTSITPTSPPGAVNVPLGQLPASKPKQVYTTDTSGEYSEIRQFPTIPNIRPPLPLPKPPPGNKVNMDRDESYVVPIVSPSVRAKQYEQLNGYSK